MIHKNNRVVAFIHTYAQDGEFGSFFLELIKGFVNAGVELHLVKTNDLVKNLGNKSLSHDIDEEKIIDYINNVKPAFIFTTNHGGVTKKIMKDISCPIVTWMVDRIPFLHHGGGHHDAFCEKDYLVTSSYKNVARLEAIYPVLKGRVNYLPFATNVADFKRSAPAQDINISFVGTYFYCGLLTTILQAYQNNPEINWNILKLAEKIKENYDLNVEQYIGRYNLQKVLNDFSLDSFRLKGLLANAISLNDRIKYLHAVSDLGLTFWGTENWIFANQFSIDLLQCFRFNEFIKTRSQLVDVYQRSKIAINVPHHQAQDGLPYRVFDIMASDALLITNYRKDSDLYKLFGRNMPVPMYRDTNDLRTKVKYYLNNENERLNIVEQCKQLVKKGYSFEDRVRNFFSITNKNIDCAMKGRVVNIQKRIFLKRLYIRSEGLSSSIINNRKWKSSSIFLHRCTSKSIKILSEKVSPSHKNLIKRYAESLMPFYLQDIIWEIYQASKK